MAIHPETPPDIAGNNFRNWLVRPSEITQDEMNELAAALFSTGSGLRWLEGFMWQVMFSTPTDASGEMLIRDVGKQDLLRLIVAQVHAGHAARGETSNG